MKSFMFNFWRIYSLLRYYRKGRTRDQIANIHWVTESKGITVKISISASLIMLKSFCE